MQVDLFGFAVVLGFRPMLQNPEMKELPWKATEVRVRCSYNPPTIGLNACALHILCMLMYKYTAVCTHIEQLFIKQCYACIPEHTQGVVLENCNTHSKSTFWPVPTQKHLQEYRGNSALKVRK